MGSGKSNIRLDGKPPGAVELRTFLVNLRAGDGEQAGHLVGHAAIFNATTRIGGWFEYDEKIAPGAFADSIQQDDIRALWNHNPDFVLGRNRSGTLKLTEDQRGLAIDNTHPTTQTIMDLVVAPIVRGDVNQMSFAFETLDDEWNFENDIPICTLRKVKLYDVSPVTFPAYETTDVSARTWARAKEMRSKFTGYPAFAQRERELELLARA